VPHVGIERLAAGDGEDDGRKNVEASEPVMGEIADRVMRREGAQNLGIVGDVIDPECGGSEWRTGRSE